MAMADRLRRRDVLAIASAVAVAGCSGTSDDPDPQPSNESDPDDNSSNADPSANESEQGDVVDNEADSEDELGEGNESDSTDQNPDDSDQEDDQEEQQDEDEEEPTDEELAQQSIDEAQSAFSEAVDELVSQAGPNRGVTDISIATDLSAGPVGDHLSATRDALEDARSYDADQGQEITIDTIADAEMLIRTIVETQPTLYDVYVDVDLFREDLVAENFDAVSSDADRTQRSIDDAQPDLDELLAAFDEATTKDFDRVEALSEDAATTVIDGFENDIGAMKTFVSTAGTFAEAYPQFWDAYDQYQDKRTPEEAFSDAQTSFEEILKNLDEVTSVAFESMLSDFECTTAALAEAANDYRVACQAREVNDIEERSEREDEAATHLDDAHACEMFDINSRRAD
jgi:hypothetical protein